MANQITELEDYHARYKTFDVDLPFVKAIISKNNPPIDNSNIKDGQYCWAVCENKLLAVCKFSDTVYEGVGRWKNKINIKDLSLVQTFER